MNLKLSRSRIAASVATSVIVLTSPAYSASIGVNFVGGAATSPGDPGPKILASTDLAGVVSSSNWNNASGAGDTLSNLDSDVGATATSVTFTSDATWTAHATPSGATPDEILTNGYIDNTSNAAPITISFANLPFIGNYDVYLYYGSDGNNRTGTVTLASTVFNIRTNTNPFGGFVEGTLADDDPDSGNYVMFSGVTGNTFSVDVARGSNNVGVHGIQVIGTVPEPATYSLLALGVLTAFLRRRRG